MFSAVRPAVVRSALAAALVTSAVPAIAQQARAEFVVAKPTVAHLWLHVASQKVADLQPGTKVDVIDKDGDWLWVIVPPDAHGTRRSGWVRANTVEMVPIRPAAALSTDARQDLAVPAPAAEPAANTEDKVTISVSETHGDMTSSAPAAAAAVTTFDDVHFDRNRAALRQEDTDTLQKMVAALKADPSLVVDIEGHTCNLGTVAYNRALGLRRARAVKDYLVSAGIEANRLRTVTKGEADPQYDNSHEETRKLNRRVALVPEPRR